MKILFIYPVAYEPTYQEGIASISAVLKRAGHQVKLLIFNEFDKIAKFTLLASTLSFQPQMILFYSMTNQFSLTERIVDYIFKEYKLPIVLGGIHPTVAPNEALAVKGVFAVCIGEGEQAVLEVVEAIERGSEYNNIKNLWIKKRSKIIKNELRPLIPNLDTLPLPDRDLFAPYIKKYHGTSTIFFLRSRGCIYNCKYCSFNAWNRIYEHNGKRFRSKSPDRVINEIKSTLNRFGKTDAILFEDCIFTLDEYWLEEFCDKYSKKVKLPFVCTAHPKHINKRILHMLKKSGCIEIPIAIESGNDFIRKKILGKYIEKDEILSAVSAIKSFKLITNCYILIGAPYETEETIKDTMKFLKKVHPDRIFASVFRPFPGTELFDLCSTKGWISNRVVKSINDPEYILDQPSISRERIIWYYNNHFQPRPRYYP
jgi:anaerobic magnesium-protoporphyrin IX monomethyl ester cyclase